MTTLVVKINIYKYYINTQILDDFINFDTIRPYLF